MLLLLLLLRDEARHLGRLLSTIWLDPERVALVQAPLVTLRAAVDCSTKLEEKALCFSNPHVVEEPSTRTGLASELAEAVLGVVRLVLGLVLGVVEDVYDVGVTVLQ